MRGAGACALAAVLMIGLTASPAAAVNPPPDPPPQPTVTASSAGGTGQITVTFQAPTNPPIDPITSYTATCNSSDSGTQGVVSNTGAVSPISVPADSGHNYTCNVIATNIDGPSTPSPDSASILVASAPDTPAQPTVTRGSNNLSVTFTPPAANGSNITGFTAFCGSSDGGVPGIGSGPASPIVATGETNGKTYTCHVTATNGIGTSAASLESSPAVVVAAVPAAPAAPTISPGNAQIVVAFTAPANGGDPITGYTAACTSTNGGAPGSVSGPGSPITVTGLTNTSTYSCAVSATNSIGTGAASAASASVVLGVPATPVAPTLTSLDSSLSVNLSTLPNDNGNPITSFGAACRSTDNSSIGFATGPSLPLTVPNLMDGLAYHCHMTATNAAGTSLVSPESTNVVPAGEPGDPPQPTVAPSNQSIKVTFGAAPNNGSPITSYTVTCTSSDGGAPGTMSGPASPITVTGLTNGNTYTCNVRAFNTVGGSALSPDSLPIVVIGAPDAPAKPTVVGGPGRVVVSFALPADNGDPIFEATASCSSSNGGVGRSVVNQPQDAGETISPVTVTGLTNGKTYTCKVTVTNNGGTSPASPVSGTAVPRTPPGAPSRLVVQSGQATGSIAPLVVSFQSGATNGSPITSYRATCTNLSTGLQTSKTGAGTTITVTGLATGKRYSCVAFAISLGGTSPASAAAQATVGTPGAPFVARILQTNSGVTVSFGAPAANGRPITSYRMICTSTNGGTKRGALASATPMIVKSLTLGRTYVCVLTAINARGQGAPANVGPFTVTK